MRGLAEITKSVVHTMGSVIAFQKENTQWLENRDKPSEQDSAKDNSVDDQQLEQDRQAFLDKLSKNGRRTVNNEAI